MLSYLEKAHNGFRDILGRLVYAVLTILALLFMLAFVVIVGGIPFLLIINIVTAIGGKWVHVDWGQYLLFVAIAIPAAYIAYILADILGKVREWTEVILLNNSPSAWSSETLETLDRTMERVKTEVKEQIEINKIVNGIEKAKAENAAEGKRGA